MIKFLLYMPFANRLKRARWGTLKANVVKTPPITPIVFALYLNYTIRKVMLINSLMYEGNIQISEYEGTYLTLI